MVDGFAFSANGTGLRGRARVTTTASSLIYRVDISTMIGVERREVRSAAGGNWAEWTRAHLELTTPDAPTLPVVADAEVNITNDVAAQFPALADLSGNGYDVELVNAEPGDYVEAAPGGADGYALELNGHRKQYGTAGDVLDFEATRALMASAWVKTTATGTMALMSKIGGANPVGWELLLSSSAGKPELLFQGWSGTGTVYLAVRTNTAVVNDGQPHLVTATSDGTGAAGIKILIDGAVVTDLHTVFDTLGSALVTNHGDFNLGSKSDGSTCFTGQITDPSVHNRVLTTAEVLAMYHGGVPIDLRTLPSATALAAYWRTTTG